VLWSPHWRHWRHVAGYTEQHSEELDTKQSVTFWSRHSYHSCLLVISPPMRVLVLRSEVNVLNEWMNEWIHEILHMIACLNIMQTCVVFTYMHDGFLLSRKTVRIGLWSQINAPWSLTAMNPSGCLRTRDLRLEKQGSGVAAGKKLYNIHTVLHIQNAVLCTWETYIYNSINIQWMCNLWDFSGARSQVLFPISKSDPMSRQLGTTHHQSCFVTSVEVMSGTLLTTSLGSIWQYVSCQCLISGQNGQNSFVRLIQVPSRHL